MSDVGTPVDVVSRVRVIEGIGTLLPRVLRREIDDLSEGTPLMDGLCMSSANMLELMLELEESLDVQVDVEDLAEDDLSTVGSLADYIVAHARSFG